MNRPIFDNWKKAENYYRIAIQQVDIDLPKLEEKVVLLKRKRAEYVSSLKYIIKKQEEEKQDDH